MSAIPLQQSKSSDPVEELVDVTVRQWRDPHEDVLENLNVNAAESEGYEGAEHGVLHDSHHCLDASTDHRLDDHAVDLRAGRHLPDRQQNGVERVTNRCGVRYIEPNGADVGLVLDVSGA